MTVFFPYIPLLTELNLLCTVFTAAFQRQNIFLAKRSHKSHFNHINPVNCSEERDAPCKHTQMTQTVTPVWSALLIKMVNVSRAEIITAAPEKQTQVLLKMA